MRDNKTIRSIVAETVRMVLGEEKTFRVADQQEFKDALLDLTTLDLEDDQVRYPTFNEKSDGYLFAAGNAFVHIRNARKMPVAGPFELFLLDQNTDEPIGFARGTKNRKWISFNLIFLAEENRGAGIGTALYENFLNEGLIIKSDTEITDGTYSLYLRLLSYGCIPLVFDDGTVGLKKR